MKTILTCVLIYLPCLLATCVLNLLIIESLARSRNATETNAENFPRLSAALSVSQVNFLSLP